MIGGDFKARANARLDMHELNAHRVGESGLIIAGRTALIDLDTGLSGGALVIAAFAGAPTSKFTGRKDLLTTSSPERPDDPAMTLKALSLTDGKIVLIGSNCHPSELEPAPTIATLEAWHESRHPDSFLRVTGLIAEEDGLGSITLLHSQKSSYGPKASHSSSTTDIEKHLALEDETDPTVVGQGMPVTRIWDSPARIAFKGQTAEAIANSLIISFPQLGMGHLAVMVARDTELDHYPPIGP